MSRHGAKCGDLSAQPGIRELPNQRGKFYFLAPDPAYSSAYGPKKTTGYFFHSKEIVHMLQLRELPPILHQSLQNNSERNVYFEALRELLRPHLVTV